MKLSTYVVFIAIIAGVMTLYSDMVIEANTYYPDAHIDSSAWANKYDLTVRMNSSLMQIKDRFDVITNENEGFFTKIAAGIVAIPYGVILVPQLAFESASIGLDIVNNIITDLGIDPRIIWVGFLLIFIFVIFALIGFYQRMNI